MESYELCVELRNFQKMVEPRSIFKFLFTDGPSKGAGCYGNDHKEQYYRLGITRRFQGKWMGVDIYWEQGSWGLYLRLLTSEGWDEFQAVIKVGTTNVLETELGVLFGIAGKPLKEIAVTDYTMNIEERKVRFVEL